MIDNTVNFCDYEICVSSGEIITAKEAVIEFDRASGTIFLYGRNGETLCIVPVIELEYAVKLG